jgi:hypothetical protein
VEEGESFEGGKVWEGRGIVACVYIPPPPQFCAEGGGRGDASVLVGREEGVFIR